MAVFFTNRAAVDYLTLTCWLPETFALIQEVLTLRDDPDKCEEARMRMYQGYRCNWTNGGVFWGSGENNGRLHHIVQVSGAASDGAAFAMSRQDPAYWKVTRVDFQITIPLPDWYKSRAFVDTLRRDDWPGRTRKVNLIDGGGEDTVYIGSRMSERFIRVYVKESDWLRFEVEYKGDLAGKAFERYARTPFIAAAGILVSEIMRLPSHPVLKLFLEQLSNARSIEVQSAKPTTTPSKAFKWFQRQVYPALDKLLNDHDVGQRTYSLLQGLLDDYKERQEGRGV